MTLFDFLDKHPWFGLAYLIVVGFFLALIGKVVAGALPSRYRCEIDPYDHDDGCLTHPCESKTIAEE